MRRLALLGAVLLLSSCGPCYYEPQPCVRVTYIRNVKPAGWDQIERQVFDSSSRRCGADALNATDSAMLRRDEQ